MNEEVKGMLNAKNVKDVRFFSALEGMSEEEFANLLMANAIDEYKLIKSGGIVEGIPNPQFNNVDPEHGKIFIELLRGLSRSMYENNLNIEFPLLPMIEFFATRLFKDDVATRETFKNNLRIEATQEE